MPGRTLLSAARTRRRRCRAAVGEFGVVADRLEPLDLQPRAPTAGHGAPSCQARNRSGMPPRGSQKGGLCGAGLDCGGPARDGKRMRRGEPTARPGFDWSRLDAGWGRAACGAVPEYQANSSWGWGNSDCWRDAIIGRAPESALPPSPHKFSHDLPKRIVGSKPSTNLH